MNHTLEVQPPFFIGWFTKHRFVVRVYHFCMVVVFQGIFINLLLNRMKIDLYTQYLYVNVFVLEYIL